MNPRPAHLIYEFGEFRLDALRRVLSRVDGRPLQITGKIFDTLLFFVERAGQLLDKRMLLEALWPNVVVEESNLTQTIHTLRRVLGERPDEHRFIVTVPGRGYRFVAAVTTSTAAEPPASRKMLRWFAAPAVVIAALALLLVQWRSDALREASPTVSMPSVAVLPFVDMSETQDQVYFADGLTEEILNLLAQSTTLRVIARTSSFSFRERSGFDIARIADKLDVTHVLEGSVRKSGGRIRITAQLVDGATSAHLWSQTYDRDVTDVFGVQDDIARAVAESLQVTLTGDASPPGGATKSAQAFEHYLRGRYFFNRRGEADVLRAQGYFEQALQIDPNYARAWAGVAGAYFVAQPLASGDALSRWREAVEKALALGPNVAEAHIRAAQLHFRLGDLRAAEEHCKRAIALSPSDPLVLGTSAGRALDAGHWSEGISLQRRAVAVDPLAAAGRANLGLFLASGGEWEEARAELEKARELSPTLSRIDSEIARVTIMQGRFDEALAIADRVPAGPQRDQVHALLYHATGQSSTADAALARLIALADAPDSDAAIDISIAEVHAFRGDEDAALEWLAHALERSDRGGASNPRIRSELTISPFLGALHLDARWQSLLARADTQ